MEQITIALTIDQMQAMITCLDEFSKQIDNLYAAGNLPSVLSQNCIDTLNAIARINEKILTMQSVFTPGEVRVMADAAATAHKTLNSILDDENAPADFRNEALEEYKKVNRLKKHLFAAAKENQIDLQ